eukprot:scaffold131883_cov39-Prasinocladus_malaysianus.AAC.3
MPIDDVDISFDQKVIHLTVATNNSACYTRSLDGATSSEAIDRRALAHENAAADWPIRKKNTMKRTSPASSKMPKTAMPQAVPRASRSAPYNGGARIPPQLFIELTIG